jgi:hypothetical protein
MVPISPRKCPDRVAAMAKAASIVVRLPDAG